MAQSPKHSRLIQMIVSHSNVFLEVDLSSDVAPYKQTQNVHKMNITPWNGSDIDFWHGSQSIRIL